MHDPFFNFSFNFFIYFFKKKCWDGYKTCSVLVWDTVHPEALRDCMFPMCKLPKNSKPDITSQPEVNNLWNCVYQRRDILPIFRSQKRDILPIFRSQRRDILPIFRSFLHRGIASLTVPGGQEFHFLHFSSNFCRLLLFFLKFLSSFWPSGWATRPPGKALAMPLFQQAFYALTIGLYNSFRGLFPWPPQQFIW